MLFFLLSLVLHPAVVDVICKHTSTPSVALFSFYFCDTGGWHEKGELRKEHQVSILFLPLLSFHFPFLISSFQSLFASSIDSLPLRTPNIRSPIPFPPILDLSLL